MVLRVFGSINSLGSGVVVRMDSNEQFTSRAVGTVNGAGSVLGQYTI